MKSCACAAFAAASAGRLAALRRTVLGIPSGSGSRTITAVDPELTLQGLRLVWQRNRT